MTRPTRLYWKISGVFLLLLVGLGASYVASGIHSARSFARETDQKLNRELASKLAESFQAHLEPDLDIDGVGHAFHDLMVMNPRVELYLLDQQGDLVAYFAEPEKIKRMSVSTGPIERYLAQDDASSPPIYGDDPRSTDRRKPFSATPVMIGGVKPGYLYVILGGEQYDSTSGMVQGSYIVRTSSVVIGGTFVVAGRLVGLEVLPNPPDCPAR